MRTVNNYKAHGSAFGSDVWKNYGVIFALSKSGKVYIASFAAGMGPVPWIFPLNIKGTAGSLATLVNWFCFWAVAYTFYMWTNWSSYGTYLVYGAVNILAFIFVLKVVPETKGRTLEQIQASINV